ncbi:hypothetical protein B0H10DRAFT_2038515, partial [Mycena sp. CBHHK59/15]
MWRCRRLSFKLKSGLSTDTFPVDRSVTGLPARGYIGSHANGKPRLTPFPTTPHNPTRRCRTPCSRLPLVSRAATPATSRACPARPISAASAPSRHWPRPSPHPASRPSPSSAARHVTTTARATADAAPAAHARSRARTALRCAREPTVPRIARVAELDRRGRRRKSNRWARTQPSDVARAAATAQRAVPPLPSSIRGVTNTTPI